VYGLNSCNQYPANGVFYRNIALLDQNGQRVSPGFSPVYGTPTPDPWCDFNVTYTDTTVNLYHNVYVPPPLDASILGPSQVQAGQYCTWWASVSGGQSPYSYQWSGKLSGTGSQVSGRLYSSGWLDLTVTDAAQHTDHASLYVTVGGSGSPLGPQTLCPM
jgi:hypothetical protein